METSSWVTLVLLILTMLSFALVSWLRRRGDNDEADMVEKIEPVVMTAVQKLGEQQQQVTVEPLKSPTTKTAPADPPQTPTWKQ